MVLCLRPRRKWGHHVALISRWLSRGLSRGFLLLCFILGGSLTVGLIPKAVSAAESSSQSAVVIMYHRFGEKKFPSTNITLQQFEEHIKILTSGAYTVLPLPEIIEKIRAGKSLPARTVGISIDDAYRSTFTEAWPRLKKAKLPFTVFVSTNHVDRKLSTMMSWDQIRTLKENGVTIGHHTTSHLHMADYDEKRNKRDVVEASKRFQKELGFVPKVFAYPYGEASQAIIKIIQDAGFTAAFGQHSGAFEKTSALFYLPRFAMNETYGSAARFKLAIDSIALPLLEVTPEDPLITTNNPPAIGFTIARPIKGLKRLACYTSHAGRAQVLQLGVNRIEVRIKKPLLPGRTRLNCTLPSTNGRWYWFGQQYYVSKKSR